MGAFCHTMNNILHKIELVLQTLYSVEGSLEVEEQRGIRDNAFVD